MIYSLISRNCRQIYCCSPLNQFPVSFTKQLTLRKISKPNIQLTCSLNLFKKNETPVDVQNNGVEIYKGELSKTIYRVKLFSLMTSAFAIMTQPMVLQKILQNDVNIAVMIISGSMVAFFTVATPLLLHKLSNKYVTTLFYSQESDTYKARTYAFFLYDKELKFKKDDVVIPETPAFLTTFQVHGVSLFVDPASFLDVKHYKRLMGYDKPLDLKLGADGMKVK